jgi:hypothetical protein
VLPCLDPPLYADADETVFRTPGISLLGTVAQAIGSGVAVALEWGDDMLNNTDTVGEPGFQMWDALNPAVINVVETGLYAMDLKLTATVVTALKSLRADVQLTRPPGAPANINTHDFLTRNDAGTSQPRVRFTPMALLAGDSLRVFLTPSYAGGSYLSRVSFRMVGTWPA